MFISVALREGAVSVVLSVEKNEWFKKTCG
jgi:hypothetical protein